MPDELTPTNAFTPLEKKGMAATFGGAGLALGSELFNINGMNGPVTQASLVAGACMVAAGCVALILSEIKKHGGKSSQIQTTGVDPYAEQIKKIKRRTTRPDSTYAEDSSYE